jgi:hypothetical protein
MSDNVEQLQQRVARQKEKLEDAAGAVELTQERFDASAAAYEQADVERKRLKTSLKLAKRRARRLKKEAKGVQKLVHATKDDRDDAARELDEHVAVRDKRAAKLAKAEAELAAVPVVEVSTPAPPAPAPPVKKAAPARKAPAKKAAVKKSPVKKAPAKKAPVKRTPARP